MLCVRCKKRTAIVFVQKLENGQPKQEGYCLTCARELGIKPVDDLMKQFGVSDQDLESMEERMSSFMEEAGENGMAGMFPFGPVGGGEEETGEGGEEDGGEDGFTPGGPPPFPLALAPTGKKSRKRKTAGAAARPSFWINTASR